MSDILDLVDSETRHRYLERASKDGYAVLPDLNSRKRKPPANPQAVGDADDVISSSADAPGTSNMDTNNVNGGNSAGVSSLDAALGDDDEAPLLSNDQAEASDEYDDGSDDSDDEDRKRKASLNADRKSTTSSGPMSKRMRVAYWSCFSVVFSAGAACIVLLILASPTCNNSDSTDSNTTASLAWWQRTVIYQVYPRSLQDSDADGVGDINGILSRLDYIYGLGVRTIWLSPVFQSPMADFGYDISNYEDIDKAFGTLADFDRLLSAIHSYGMYLLLDFVPNHTSDQHPWFLESRANVQNPKRDWYIWRNGSEHGGPPNNWQSVFGGSAWEYDNITNQYYLHQFTKEQPDLNYRNPNVTAAMEDVLRFWLRRGVDGFRVDAIGFLLESPSLQNETCTANGMTSIDCDDYNTMNHSQTFAQPGYLSVVRRYRQVLDCYSSANQTRFMVGEMYSPSLADVVELYGNTTAPLCDFPFNFLLLGLERSQWTGVVLNRTISQWLDATTSDQWPNWVLGNHDNSRLASRLGSVLARTANFLLMTLPGTPTTYYGEEIGMTDGEILPSQVRDPSALNTGDFNRSRDPERTPMQWNSSVNAGFSAPGVATWLPVASSYRDVNVATQSSTNTSMLSLYKELVKVRSSEPSLQQPGYRSVYASASVLAFVREYNGTVAASQFLVVLNFGSATVTKDLATPSLSAYLPTGNVVLSASLSFSSNATIDLGSLTMTSGEALLVRLVRR